MRIEERAVSQIAGTILMHNLADDEGRRTLRKGTLLTANHMTQLLALGHTTVTVAILDEGDVHEDNAARELAQALLTSELALSPSGGGRVNLRATVDGLLQIDAERLLSLNMVPGITLATRRQHFVAGPHQETDNVATLKIIPYAVRRVHLDQALSLARTRPGILELRPFPHGRQVALLLIGEPAMHSKLRDTFEPPTRARLERLGASLSVVEGVTQDEATVGQTAVRLAESADLLVIAGQTSVMDQDDTTLRALRAVGAETTLSGAPVEPGNLLALAYLPQAPVLCAPGCARSLKRNVVDLLLPRLLLGDRLERRDIAALGLGGFLTPAERTGEES